MSGSIAAGPDADPAGAFPLLLAGGVGAAGADAGGGGFRREGSHAPQLPPPLQYLQALQFEQAVQ